MCEYGSIVGLNHTVHKIGVASGRIVGATTNTVLIDKTVPLLAGLTYQIIR
ncbi:hypothetical protein Ga0466249_005418 [Sporomusaceae bacterium BoRhaA]|nr:hypothetical protein [Pelorhabdus rhamnosifermentans]